MQKETPEDLKLQTLRLKEAAMVFRAINHDLRLEILRLVHQKNRMNVTSMYREIGEVQSIISSHLRILRKARLVTTERDKRSIYYCIDYKRMEQLNGIAKALLSFKDCVDE